MDRKQTGGFSALNLLLELSLDKAISLSLFVVVRIRLYFITLNVKLPLRRCVEISQRCPFKQFLFHAKRFRHITSSSKG